MAEITLRVPLGRPLTYQEVDDNFRSVQELTLLAQSFALTAQEASTLADAAKNEAIAAKDEALVASGSAASDAQRAEVAADRAEAIAGFDGLHNTLAGRNVPGAHDASAIGFKQEGVGAVERSLADKASEIKTIHDFNSLSEAIHRASTEGFSIQILEDVLVKVPTDAPSLQSIFRHLSPALRWVKITILIEAGHKIESGFFIENGDYSQFEIASEDDEVLLSPNFVGAGPNRALMLAYSATTPKWNVFVDMGGIGGHGIELRNNSFSFIYPNKGIKGAIGLTPELTAGIFVERSQVSAESSKFIENGRNIWATVASQAFFQMADLRNALAIGAYVSRASTAALSSAKLSGAGNVGIWALGVIVHAGTADVSNCGTNAIYAQRASSVHVINANLQNAGIYGVSCIEGSTVNATDSNTAGAGTFGYRVGDGGHIIRTRGIGTNSLPKVNAWTPRGCITDDSVSPMTIPIMGYLDGSAVIHDSWDDIVETGLYRASNSSAQGVPTAELTWSCLHIQLTKNSATQFAMLTSSNRVSFRRKSDGQWQPWVSLID